MQKIINWLKKLNPYRIYTYSFTITNYKAGKVRVGHSKWHKGNGTHTGKIWALKNSKAERSLRGNKYTSLEVI